MADRVALTRIVAASFLQSQHKFCWRLTDVKLSHNPTLTEGFEAKKREIEQVFVQIKNVSNYYSLTSISRDCKGPSRRDRELTEVTIIKLFLLKIWKKKFENRTNNKGVRGRNATMVITSSVTHQMCDHTLPEV